MFPLIMNPLLLAGLLGIGLPVLAHLLSRRKYDVVQWGAMQFLNPSRKTRRRMQLEELLLLLIRMAIIALVVLALCRFSINSGFLLGYRSAGSRDVVLVIDGSNSMGRSDGLTSLHDKAIRRAKAFLKTLNSADTVTLIDARDQPIRVVDSPLTDRDLLSERLDEIPTAAGAANLLHACEEAVAILGRCSNATREVIVFTDRQRAGWDVADDAAWQRFDEVLKFPVVRPKVWVVDVSAGLGAIRQNISVGQVDVSRDLTVPGFPINFQVPISNASTATVEVPVQVLVNGQRLANMDSTISVGPTAETLFSRSLRFSSPGTNMIGVQVSLPNDAVEVDNASFAAVQVQSAIPVLLVEGSLNPNRQKRNTLFAELALSAPENKSPWIVARTVLAKDLTIDDLDDMAAIVLANIAELPTDMPAAIKNFAAAGHGVLIALGPDDTAESFERNYGNTGLFPNLKLKRRRLADPDAIVATTMAPYSIEAGWLNRFRERKGASLLTAPFDQWWLVEASSAATDEAPPVPANDSKPVTLATLTSGDPLLLQVSCGRGSVLLMTSNIDTQWNSLATTPDYVPFLHEALFQMAAARISRNVSFGEPLLTTLPAEVTVEQQAAMIFRIPFGTTEPAIITAADDEWMARLNSTRLPGVYELSPNTDPDSAALDAFVVNYDHSEDDPAEITPDDRERLLVNNRLTFMESIEDLQQGMYSNESCSELWALLLWLFLGFLMLEVWMTRRLVLKGHVDT